MNTNATITEKSESTDVKHPSCSLYWTEKDVKDSLIHFDEKAETSFNSFLLHCYISGDIFKILLQKEQCFCLLLKNPTLSLIQLRTMYDSDLLTNEFLKETALLQSFKVHPQMKQQFLADVLARMALVAKS